MAVTRLNCPECGTTLRPAKPVAPGKKVKCPECDTVFVAGEDEDLDERPRKKPARQSAPQRSTKKAAPVKQKPPPKKEEEETYGYIKEDEDEEEEEKPRINYVPDESVKDLRGPAIVKLTGPATKLQFVGFIGVLGTLMLTLLLIIPAMFPIKDEPKPDNPYGVPQEQEKDKKKEKSTPVYHLFGNDIYWIVAPTEEGGLPWYLFLIVMGVLALLMFYSAMVVAGGIKMQNLESRTWGFVGAVMAILPINVFGLTCVTTLVFQYLIIAFLDDETYAYQISGALAAIAWLASAVVGGIALRTLMDEDVIDGFEFDPE